jgi:hypothetical protein
VVLCILALFCVDAAVTRARLPAAGTYLYV